MEDYQSIMAVRPLIHPDKPGIEFSVTAFEDPGVALPDSLINWWVSAKNVKITIYGEKCS